MFYSDPKSRRSRCVEIVSATSAAFAYRQRISIHFEYNFQMPVQQMQENNDRQVPATPTENSFVMPRMNRKRKASSALRSEPEKIHCFEKEKLDELERRLDEMRKLLADTDVTLAAARTSLSKVTENTDELKHSNDVHDKNIKNIWEVLDYHARELAAIEEEKKKKK